MFQGMVSKKSGDMIGIRFQHISEQTKVNYKPENKNIS